MTVTPPLNASVDAATTLCALAGAVLSCDLGSLSGGGGATRNVTFTSTAPGPFVVSASVTAATADPDLANNAAVVSGSSSSAQTEDQGLLAALQDAYGASSGEPAYDASADLNGDGTVNLQDLAILAADMGT